MNTETIYNERTAAEPLSQGYSVLVRGVGNSMTPRFTSGQVVRVDPITTNVVISKGDAVLAKVHGRYYLHKVTGIKKVNGGNLYQISNNHGHINGWTTLIFGKVRE